MTGLTRPRRYRRTPTLAELLRMAVLRSVAIVTGLGLGFGTLAVAWEGPDTITAPMPAPGEPAAPDGCCR